jgi:hypothetical protein
MGSSRLARTRTVVAGDLALQPALAEVVDVVGLSPDVCSHASRIGSR